MREKLFYYITKATSVFFIFLFSLIIFHIVTESMYALTSLNTSLLSLSKSWKPMASNPEYSIMPMLLTTLEISFLAVVFALPLCISIAVSLAFYIKEIVAVYVLTFIDLLAGVPSVIFGFIGLTVLVKKFELFFSMPTGECLLLGAIVLAVMLFPFCTSTIYESLIKLKKEYYNCALSLGYSKEFIISKILLKALKPSILTAFIMALGRAMGETMAVMMVIGNAPQYPQLFKRVLTIPALTALELGNAEYASLHFSALYAANLVLLILLAFLMILVKIIQVKVVKNNEN
ncbi:MAG: PstC family ABC transporter permease [Lachnospirales bacterium]